MPVDAITSQSRGSSGQRYLFTVAHATSASADRASPREAKPSGGTPVTPTLINRKTLLQITQVIHQTTSTSQREEVTAADGRIGTWTVTTWGRHCNTLPSWSPQRGSSERRATSDKPRTEFDRPRTHHPVSERFDSAAPREPRQSAAVFGIRGASDSALMTRDLRYAIRVLLRSPLFTSVAALSLAIGIGGAATVFAVLNAVILRSLPIANPQQLYLAEKHRAEEVSPRYSYVLFEQARDEVRGRAELFAATNATSMYVRIGGRTDPAAAERALVQLVSGEYFGALRQRAQRGRLIEESDNLTTANPVAVISDTFWERGFRRAGDVVGRELIIGGTNLTIIGVAAPGFFGPFLAVRNPEVWVPLIRQ